MGIDPELMKTIDAARDDSVNLRVGVLNQSIVDVHGYSLEAVLTNVDTGEETHLVGEDLRNGLGVKYNIPVELVSKRSKYLLDLGDGHVVSVYVTKRSIEHVITESGVFYIVAAEDGEEDEDMALIVNATWNNDEATLTLDKTFKEIKDAMLSGKLVYVVMQPYTRTGSDSDIYYGYEVDVVVSVCDVVNPYTGEPSGFVVNTYNYSYDSIAETDYPGYMYAKPLG